MPKGKDELLKEKEEVQILLSQVEEEYRKANISEEVYKEMKEKYEKRLKEINKKLGIKESSDEKKKGILDKLLGKKEEEKKDVYQTEEKKDEPVFFDPLNPPKEILEEVKNEEEKREIKEGVASPEIIMEIERFKATLEAFKEEKKVMTEQIRTINESIGELRSLIFQTDTSLRELEIKFDKLNTQVEEIEPSKYMKKIMEIEGRLEKFDAFIEKTERKIEDLSKDVGKIHEFLRTAGSLENIIEISKTIDQKVKDIKDAISYIERIATKVEATFVEMNRNLQDFRTYKTRQEGVEDSLKEVLKNLDSLNAKVENLVTKTELEAVKTDIARIDSQLKEFEKSVPLIEAKIPETIRNLRDEKNDLVIFLDSLESQLKEGKISLGEYEKTKKEIEKKIREIEAKLIDEWKKIEKFLETGGIEYIPKTEEKEEVEVKKEEEKILKVPIETEEEYVEIIPFVKKREEKLETKTEIFEEKITEIKPKEIKPIEIKDKEHFKEIAKRISKENK